MAILTALVPEPVDRRAEGHHGDMAGTLDRGAVVAALRDAGCVAAEEEADELLAVASGDDVGALVSRRVHGEPLAWITGRSRFCGLTVHIDSGVYVPRWQTQVLAETASLLLPEAGTAIDLCTGAGAIAMVLHVRRPLAKVLATEIDPAAVVCARRNGVAACEGDLFEPLPRALLGTIDVVTGVVPYVPSDAMHLLPRDVAEFEPRAALDGGGDGLTVLRRAICDAGAWVREGGWIALESGIDQVDEASVLLMAGGFGGVVELRDDDGDRRGVLAQRL